MATVDPMPYLPFAERGALLDGVFRWRLGARPLDLADWFEFGSDAIGPDGWIEQKQRLNADHPDVVFAALDGIEQESREVADTIAEHLAHHHPAQATSLDPTLHPLDAAARLVPDDLVVMVERPSPPGGRLIFGGGSVCFPNRWDLRSKLGLTMAEVHEPVADLNAQLGPHIDRFLERLTPGAPFWRLGWGIIDSAEGHAPPDGARQRPSPPSEPASMFLRVERETLRRFPETRCVLFTIRTYVTPIERIVDAADRAALSAALDGMPTDIRGYKDLIDTADRVSAMLRGDSFRS